MYVCIYVEHASIHNFNEAKSISLRVCVYYVVIFFDKAFPTVFSSVWLLSGENEKEIDGGMV